MSLIDNLHWRYATKRMNGQKVPQEKIDRILEAIRLAPSSAGLQPYNVLVIENPELQKQLQPVAFNQAQIVEASHLLIFAAWDNVTPQQVNDYISFVASSRNMDPSGLDVLKNSLLRTTERPAEVNFTWTARQAYIALGVAIAAAAEEKVDATPMEGFDSNAADALLNLKEKGLKSLAILALGYRDETNDWLLKQKKVRKPKEELFLHY